MSAAIIPSSPRARLQADSDRRARMGVPSLADGMENMRSDYQAAKTGRFRRRRTGLSPVGSGADYHYRSEADFLRIMEYARDMDRNDVIVSQMIDRAVLNTVQNGFQLDPQTGDKKLDLDLFERFEAWANDPRACDLAGEMTFVDQQEFALRHTLLDGDCFAVPFVDGQLEMIESHRCRTPSGTKRNVVLGVLLDEATRKRLEYWFTVENVDPLSPLKNVGDVTRRPAYDAEGEPNVFHVYNPKRISQTRGVSALAPAFDCLGMFEDINFAKLVQQQVASCVAFISERTADFAGGAGASFGPQTTETINAYERLVQELTPGLHLKGARGEKITGFSPNVPNQEFFQHARLMLQLIGVNIGMPLVLLLLDASDTNFSGWRGAVDQARMGFRRNQRWLRDRFVSRVYRWKLRQFAADDAPLRASMLKLGDKFFAHAVNTPRWTYVQPLQDAQANELRKKDLQISPRRLSAELGVDHDVIVEETVADNKLAIAQAIKAANEIEAETGVKVDWHELLYPGKVDKVTLTPGIPAPGSAPGSTPGSTAAPSQAPSPEPQASPSDPAEDGSEDDVEDPEAEPPQSRVSKTTSKRRER